MAAGHPISQPTMAAGFAAALLDYACAEGAPRDRLLREAGLVEGDLADQDHRIAVESYQRLVGAAITATGDTSLLLRHTLDTRLETVSIVGQIVHASTSFPHSLAQLNRYVRLMADVPILGGRDRFELAREGAAIWLIDHRPAEGFWLNTEASFARFISEFRRSVPEHPFELALEVMYPPPPHADRYPELFRVPVRFGAARNALRIDPIWLEAKFDPGRDYVFGVFTRHADALMAAVTGSWVEETTMQDDHHRLTGLHVTLTGWSARRARTCTDIPRHLWGDVGLSEGEVPRDKHRARWRFFRR